MLIPIKSTILLCFRLLNYGFNIGLHVLICCMEVPNNYPNHIRALKLCGTTETLSDIFDFCSHAFS
jgi:hypothetical protein